MLKSNLFVSLFALLISFTASADNIGLRHKFEREIEEAAKIAIRHHKLESLKVQVSGNLPSPNSSLSSKEDLGEQVKMVTRFIADAKRDRTGTARAISRMKGLAKVNIGKIEQAVDAIGGSRILDFGFIKSSELSKGLAWYQYGRDILYYKAVFNEKSGEYMKLSEAQVRLLITRGLLK
jgi:hypothetical protein